MVAESDLVAAPPARRAPIPERIRHVHLIGVAGSAMTALAGMLVAAGYRVTGSDSQLYEPAASLLRELCLEVAVGYKAANLAPAPDLAVVGNVVTRANPEAQALLAGEIPYVSMPEALRHFFLRDRVVLMVAGTHGKTTSTALAAHVMTVAGRDPSMLVGGLALDFKRNYRRGAGKHFIIEGDEYDTAFFDKGPKFLHYHPHGAIITAVEFDHADIYRDLAHVKESFRALAMQMGDDRVIVVSADFPSAIEVTDATRARRLTFGLDRGEFQAVAIKHARAGGVDFTITQDGRPVTGPLRLGIGGRMNVANALGVWVLLREFGLADAEIAEGLASFKGVKRRQEIIGEVAGIVVLDDFAHHPTAIQATLAALTERFPARRLLAAFEPRSNSARRNVFQAGFAGAFDRAAAVFLAPVYFKENDPIPPAARLDVQALAHAISARGPQAVVCASIDAMLAQMIAAARAGDVIVCMSNGPLDRLPHRLLEALARNDPNRPDAPPG